jgi:hypothetical protein
MVKKEDEYSHESGGPSDHHDEKTKGFPTSYLDGPSSSVLTSIGDPGPISDFNCKSPIDIMKAL